MIALRKTIIFLLLFQTLLFSSELQHEYIIQSDTVKLSDIIKNPKKDYILFNINPARHSKRVKSSKLIKKLKNYGYNDFHTKHAYVQFTRKSPIETRTLKNTLIKYYKEKYTHIDIQEVHINPSKYLTHLPNNYTIGFSRNAYLSHKGVMYIKAMNNKKYFFNYTILAALPVYVTTKKIEKGDEISLLNTRKKSIILDRLKAAPLMELQKNRYEAKHRLKKDAIITQRDITGLYLVKRGSNVSVSIIDEGVQITFRAKAVQNGRYGDTILVVHKNNKKIPVIVTGKNRAEVK